VGCSLTASREKIGSAIGGCKAGKGGRVGKCSRHRRGDDVDFCVAILGCYLNGKGNQLSQHLFIGREATSQKATSRRLKREIERRGTLGEFELEPDPLDLFRSDGPNAVGGPSEVESPQSVVQGCPVQGGAVGPGEKES
jgi:hypothetical protein